MSKMTTKVHSLFRPRFSPGGHLQGGELLGVLELPAVEGLLAGRDDVRPGHGQVDRIHLNVLGVQWSANRVAEHQHILPGNTGRKKIIAFVRVLQLLILGVHI